MIWNDSETESTQKWCSVLYERSLICHKKCVSYKIIANQKQYHTKTVSALAKNRNIQHLYADQKH